jgi:5'-AMP-activated protein kinase catalytic alpha subunit
MLAGYLPFYNSSGKKDIDDKIMTARYKMPEFMRNSSVKTLIEGILVVDPVKRMTLDNVLEHPWMKNYCPKNALEEVALDLDYNALATLTSSGFDKKQILKSLMDEEVTEATASYHLLALKNSSS